MKLSLNWYASASSDCGCKAAEQAFRRLQDAHCEQQSLRPDSERLVKGLQWIGDCSRVVCSAGDTRLYLFGREQILLTAGAASANHVSPPHA